MNGGGPPKYRGSSGLSQPKSPKVPGFSDFQTKGKVRPSMQRFKSVLVKPAPVQAAPPKINYAAMPRRIQMKMISNMTQGKIGYR